MDVGTPKGKGEGSMGLSHKRREIILGKSGAAAGAQQGAHHATSSCSTAGPPPPAPIPMERCCQPIPGSFQPLLFLFFSFSPSGEDKAGSSLRAPGRAVLSRTIPLVRHQTLACEPSASLTETPNEKLLDWKKDINLKSVQQSDCRVFPPPPPPRARASEGKLITMTHRSPDLIFHFKICK